MEWNYKSKPWWLCEYLLASIFQAPNLSIPPGVLFHFPEEYSVYYVRLGKLILAKVKNKEVVENIEIWHGC